jgi:hypothetical protein
VTRLPPHEPEAEKAAIGAALLSRNAIEDMIAAGLMADDFYNLQHQDVWNTIVDQHRDMGRCDVLTVTEEFSPDVRTELRVALIGYQNDVPAITNAKRYAQTIISASMSRSLIGYGADITQAGYDRPDPNPRVLPADRRHRHRRGPGCGATMGAQGDHPPSATHDDRRPRRRREGCDAQVSGVGCGERHPLVHRVPGRTMPCPRR